MAKDLFETPNKLPKKVQSILSRFNALEIEKGIEYTDLIQMGKEMAIYGYEFDFYLDCIPYNLKKISAIYVFNVYDYNNQKIEFRTKAKYRHLAYEKTHKKHPNNLLIELNQTINN
jgi:hypothetical protein